MSDDLRRHALTREWAVTSQICILVYGLKYSLMERELNLISVIPNSKIGEFTDALSKFPDDVVGELDKFSNDVGNAYVKLAMEACTPRVEEMLS